MIEKEILMSFQKALDLQTGVIEDLWKEIKEIKTTFKEGCKKDEGFPIIDVRKAHKSNSIKVTCCICKIIFFFHI